MEATACPVSMHLRVCGVWLFRFGPFPRKRWVVLILVRHLKLTSSQWLLVLLLEGLDIPVTVQTHLCGELHVVLLCVHILVLLTAQILAVLTHSCCYLISKLCYLLY